MHTFHFAPLCQPSHLNIVPITTIKSWPAPLPPRLHLLASATIIHQGIVREGSAGFAARTRLTIVKIWVPYWNGTWIAVRSRHVSVIRVDGSPHCTEWEGDGDHGWYEAGDLAVLDAEVDDHREDD